MSEETTTTTKKSAKKTAAKKAVKAPETNGARGSEYVLAAAGKKVKVEDLGPQEGLLFGAFAKSAPITVAALADAVGKKLTTNQEPKRVAAFYMTQWVKAGIAKAA